MERVLPPHGGGDPGSEWAGRAEGDGAVLLLLQPRQTGPHKLRQEQQGRDAIRPVWIPLQEVQLGEEQNWSTD